LRILTLGALYLLLWAKKTRGWEENANSHREKVKEDGKKAKLNASGGSKKELQESPHRFADDSIY